MKAAQFASALRQSRAFATGVLSDMSEAELFIHGVGPDTISDLTTNILRGPLTDYTAEQCNLYGIETQRFNTLGPIWSLQRSDWVSEPLNLPSHEGKPILLVPKFSVRLRLSIDSQEFWNHHMIEFLRQEYLNSGGALVRTFKDGTRYVTKQSVKERHPFIKDDLAQFVSRHPEILERYKAIVGARGPLTTEDLETFFDEAAFAEALIDQLHQIPHGNDAASAYHSLMLGICTFIFYPHLIFPVKEHEIHQGRKRVDLKFTNAAGERFFLRMLQANQTRSINVMIECKNYRKNINNPELDQLSSRFGHQRGFLGFLLCRQMDDRDRIIEGCRDAASDGRGYILVFEDRDIEQMLRFIQNGQRAATDRFLQERFDEISD